MYHPVEGKILSIFKDNTEGFKDALHMQEVSAATWRPGFLSGRG